MTRLLLLVFLPCLALALALTSAQGQPAKLDPKGVAFFENKIRPVLVKECYSCHSEDARKNKKLRGGLLLDTKKGLLDGGDSGPAIVPGKGKESLLVKAMRHDSVQMPPKGKLADAVVADFVKWVDMGAPDPRESSVAVLPAKRSIDIEAGKKFWAFAPLNTAPPPTVRNAGWVRNPVDRFILARLEARGLSPSKALSREKVVRRVTFGLTGLPPTPEEIEAFVKDTAPDAYEKLLDRLLKSERYGERWGRHWLDVARYAESGGYEFDKDRPGAYHYRDFVIKALNDDLPYDEFVRLQLAGDEIKPGDFYATAATGFVVAGPYPGQITAKTREPIRYDHLDDMISTIGTGLLGQSLGCARCHEHKFDPIPQQDYYHLIANLARTDSVERKMDPSPEAYKQAKATFDKEHAPLLAARAKFEKEELPTRFDAWRQSQSATDWVNLPVNGTTTVTARTHLKGITAVRVEAPEGKSAALASLAIAPLNPPPGKKAAAKAAKAGPVKLKPAQGKISVLETPVGTEAGSTLTFTLKADKDSAKQVRLAITTAKEPRADGSGTTGEQPAQEILALLAAQGGKLDGKHRDVILGWYRKLDTKSEEVFSAVDRHATREPKQPQVPVFSATSGRGGDVHYLIRGETERKNGVARPGFVQVLSSGSSGATTASPTTPRIGLANWITDSKNGAGHLLARVIVNRLWQHHFGKGIVRTPNDFGSQGEPPTHPELLDFLASELIKGGWKLKPIHKLILTSATYQQSGEINEAALKADPQNQLWWRVPPRRLEAEAIRDAVLAVGGSLDEKRFGPSVDENSNRRSVYVTVKRSRLSPMLQTFDAPEAIQSVGERSSTTATTQALAMMNSRFVRQQAEKLAARAKAGEDVGQTIEKAYLLALGRRASDTEVKRLAGFVQRTTADATKGSKGPQEMALADVCQVLLCSNEFIYVD